MPRNITVTFADGSSHVYQNAPDDVTPDAVQSRAEKQFAKTVKGIDGGASPSAADPNAAPQSMLGRAADFVKNDMAAIPGKVGNLAAGAVRGAGSIGATILAPYDMAKDALDGKGLSLESNRQRRADMTGALTDMGADPNSTQFKAGQLGAELAGTAGVGGVLAKGAQAAGAAPAVIDALASGGMSAGGMTGAKGLALRTGAGAVSGGTSAGLVDPNEAGKGALIGAATPGALKVAGAAGDAALTGMQAGAERLMQSAIKPTIAQLKSGDAKVAVETLLDRGINPTAGGVSRLRQLIDDADSKLSTAIAGSSATVNKSDVLARLAGARTKFTNQVSPSSDLNAIQGVEDDFLAHPMYSGSTIPVQAAQDLKRGTYSVLSKKYDKMGSAEIEAQKSLARGLKEEIASAVPGVQGINEDLSKLITTLNVSERRALLEMNKNPGGLALLAGSPGQWAAFMADKSSLFKSLAARALNASSGGVSGALPALANGSAARLKDMALRGLPVAATQE